jgi:hypothetical protein
MPLSTNAARSATRGGLPAHSILQPRERDDEQRREDHTEQDVDPRERDVEAAEAEADPENAQRTVSFQENAPVAVIQM